MTIKEKNNLFSSLFDTHYQRLYRYAFTVLKEKETAEELVQETFIKLRPLQYKGFKKLINF